MANRFNGALVEKLGPDWSHVAALSAELRHAWLCDHFAQVVLLCEGDRRQHLREFVEETQAMQENLRTGLLSAGLEALMDLGDDDAHSVISSWQFALDNLNGGVAYAEVTSLQTAARHLTVDDMAALGGLWPRVFGDLAGRA